MAVVRGLVQADWGVVQLASKTVGLSRGLELQVVRTSSAAVDPLDEVDTGSECESHG